MRVRKIRYRIYISRRVASGDGVCLGMKPSFFSKYAKKNKKMALNGRHATRPRLIGAFNNSLRGGQASKPSSFPVSPTLFPEKLDEVSGLEDHRDFDAFSADTFQPGDEDIESLIDEEVEEDA